MNEIRYGGEAIRTETQIDRDRARMGITAAVTPATDVVAITETRWPPMALALLRGALEGFVLGGLDALVAIQLDFSASDAFVSAGIIFFGRLAIALGVGGIDQWNSAKERHR